MIKKYITIISILCFSFFITTPITLYAEEDASITLSPKNPEPNSPVTITLVSYVFDVNTALITWSSNGKTILKGLGEKKVTIKTGNTGTQTKVHLTAVTANNVVTNLDVVVTPASVTLLYETPEAYVPPFYEGRSLPGEGAFVRFVAIPNISENGDIVSASSLAYSWYVNDTFMDDYSGAGKSAAIFNLDIFETFTRVKVVVRSPRGVFAEKYIDVYPHEIVPLLYSYDQLLGINYSEAYTKRIQAVKDFTLALEPYFLSLRGDLESTSAFTWNIDGVPSTPLGGRILALKPKENSYGTKNLDIHISNSKRRLQKADTSTSLIFDTR